jgi:hypothetical protein
MQFHRMIGTSVRSTIHIKRNITFWLDRSRSDQSIGNLETATKSETHPQSSFDPGFQTWLSIARFTATFTFNRIIFSVYARLLLGVTLPQFP